MKVIVSESLGIDYSQGIITSCDQNGMQAIADVANNEILFYDPKSKQYCSLTDLNNANASIHKVFTDKTTRNQVMKPASGKGFEEFATKWDALQKDSNSNLLKTKNCSMIRFNAHESSPKIVGTKKPNKEFMDKVERFRSKWKKLDDYEDDFGNHVNDVEAQVSEDYDDPRDWSASEGEVEIMWTRDFPECGIESGDTDHFVVEYDDVAPDNDYDIEDNGLRDEICRLIGKEYPDLDFEPYDFDILNEREFWGDEASRHIYPYDESEIETDVVEGIPNWAACYIEYGEPSGDMTDEDIEMVDAYLDKLADQGMRLIAPIEGTENDFNSHPAFGDACDTTDWTCEIG